MLFDGLNLILSTLMLKNAFAEKPNMIVFQADDMYFFEEWTPPPNNPGNLSADYFPSTNYYPQINGLPHLDALRRNGVQMMQAYAASPICGSSRYTTATGKYASRKNTMELYNNEGTSYVITKTNKLNCIDEEENIAVAMKNNGYRTGMVGKWHLGTSSSRENKTYTENQAEIKACGYDFVDGLYMHNLEAHKPDLGFQTNGNYSHNMEFVAHEAIRFINNDYDDAEEDEKPFFMYLNPTIPHMAQPAWFTFSNYTCLDTPRGKEPSDFMIKGMTEEFGGCEAYRANVEARADNNFDIANIWLDDSVGAIMLALEDRGILNNTLVLFQIDHGVETKLALFENGNRIAQFIQYPNEIPAGTKYNIPVSTIDIAATLLDYAGDDETEYLLDGVSWRRNLQTQDRLDERCLFFEYQYDRAVVCGCYKYLEIYRTSALLSETYKIGEKYNYYVERRNLFNLCGGTNDYITDPNDNQEISDLNLINQYPQLADAMEEVLHCHMSRTSETADPTDRVICKLRGRPRELL